MTQSPMRFWMLVNSHDIISVKFQKAKFNPGTSQACIFPNSVKAINFLKIILANHTLVPIRKKKSPDFAPLSLSNSFLLVLHCQLHCKHSLSLNSGTQNCFSYCTVQLPWEHVEISDAEGIWKDQRCILKWKWLSVLFFMLPNASKAGICSFVTAGLAKKEHECTMGRMYRFYSSVHPQNAKHIAGDVATSWCFPTHQPLGIAPLVS